MKRRQGTVRRVGVVTILVGLIMWSAVSVPALADLRIRTADVDNIMDETSHTELLVKQSRIRMLLPDGSGQIFDCPTGLVTMISSPEDGVYWQGTMADMAEMLADMFGSVMEELPPGLEFLFGDTGGTGEVNVRVTTIGSDTIAGYDATHYLVEYDEGNGWKTYQNVWVSRQLMQELLAEAGPCIHDVYDWQRTLSELTGFFDLFGLGAVAAVASHPDYMALMQDAYLVRSVQPFAIFGIEFEVESAVVEVSKEPLSEDLFTVPAGYTPVEDASALFGM